MIIKVCVLLMLLNTSATSGTIPPIDMPQIMEGESRISKVTINMMIKPMITVLKLRITSSNLDNAGGVRYIPRAKNSSTQNIDNQTVGSNISICSWFGNNPLSTRSKKVNTQAREVPIKSTKISRMIIKWLIDPDPIPFANTILSPHP